MVNNYKYCSSIYSAIRNVVKSRTRLCYCLNYRLWSTGKDLYYLNKKAACIICTFRFSSLFRIASQKKAANSISMAKIISF